MKRIKATIANCSFLIMIIMTAIFTVGCKDDAVILNDKETTVTELKDNIPDNENTTSKDDVTTDSQQETETTQMYIPISLAVVGDVDMSDRIDTAYKESGLQGVLSDNIINVFQNSDITAINHEYVASDHDDSHKVDYELWYYKHPTYREQYLKEMGVDVVTLANNHTMDYGEEGLIDTMEALRNVGISYVGVGKDLNEAKAAYIREINGKKIAIVAANRVVPRVDWYAGENKAGHMTTYEGTDRYGIIKDEISRLKNDEKCDLVVMLVHFGENQDPEIKDYEYNCAHGYVDAGADVVIGTHTHTLQGAEIYNGKYIFYGVGNFMFEGYAVDTVVVQLYLCEDNTVIVKLMPCKSQGFKTWDVEGYEARQIFDTITEMSVNVSISDEGIVMKK